MGFASLRGEDDFLAELKKCSPLELHVSLQIRPKSAADDFVRDSPG